MAHATLGRPRTLFVLFFCSGMGALILEILWLRKLSVVLGSTAYAAATTLSVFFLGIAIGGRLWGSASRALARPLRSYALLEIGVALTAAAAFVLLNGLDRLYQPLFAAFGEQRVLLVAARALLAAAVLIVPTVLMGGTFPLMAQRLVRRRDALGVTGGRLYAINTLGASAGALLTGFYLMRSWGVTASYFAAVGLLAAVGVVAYAGSIDEASPETGATEPSSPLPPPGALPRAGGYTGAVVSPRLVLSVSLFSGLATLALEVLWTRMFSLVLHNSVYSFSLILFTFLIALSAGAYLASRLAQLPHQPLAVLSWLAAGAGVTVVASIWVFFAVTDGLAYIAQTADWNRYLLAVLGTGMIVMLVPATLAGTLFPYLLKVEERGRTSVGRRVGGLVAANALGAVVGPLLAGFVLLETVGIWGSVALVGAAYAGLAGVVASRAWGRSAGARVLTGAAVLAAIALVARSRLPTVRTVPGEQVHAIWQGSDGVVAVVQQGDNLILKLNNSYVLGDTRSALVEEMQAHIPLLLHPNPESVFFVGLGTGITAGAALAHPVERVVAAELIPEVVDAAKRYFRGYVSGLFTDARARVVVEDGRNLLRGLPDLYDVIVGDLFTPWHAGAGSLYTVEHFRTVRERLAPGGLFAQWLPLYQLSEAEFFIIARTMTEVFPQVTVWRADFAPARPIVALVGRVTNAPLDNAVLTANARRLFSTQADTGSGEHQAGLFYAGNLGANKALFADAVVNSDERPVIEYLAPVAERQVASRTGSRLVGEVLADLFTRLLEGSPPDLDPVLARLPVAERRYVAAGLALYEYRLYEETGQLQRAKAAVRRLRDALPADMVARLVGEGEGEGEGEEGRS